MVRISSLYILLGSFLILLPGQLFSLGLGEIEVDSALNQPLNAQINLISASADELDEIRVELAPANVFERVGVPRPYFLTQLKFTPVSLVGGGAAIRITSKDPVREPFLTFLVEITWPKGRLLREYTVLLDPPEFAQRQAPQIAKPVTTPKTEEQIVEAKPVVVPKVATQAEIIAEPVDDLEAIREQMDRELGIDATEAEVVEVTPEAESISEEPTAEELEEAVVETVDEPQTIVATTAEDDIVPETEVKTKADASSVVVVESGDTLYSIAKSANQSDTMSVNQMMIAIQQANPDAFMRNNVNLLKKGAVLRIPDASKAQTVSTADARQKILQQNALWMEYRGKVSQVAATNIDAPELVKEKNDVSQEGKQELKETTKKPDAANQDLNILAAEDAKQSEGNTQAAGGEELKKLQTDLMLTKELSESRSKEAEVLKSRVKALESMLEKKEKILNIQNQQLKDLQEQLGIEAGSAVAAEKMLKEKAIKEEAKPVIKEIKKPIVEPLPEFTEPVIAEQVASKPRLEPLPDWDSLPDIEPVAKQAELLEVPETEPGFISGMVGFLEPLKAHAQKAGIGLGILAALLGLFLWRKKRAVKTIELTDLSKMQLDAGEHDEHFDDILDETIIAPQTNAAAEVSNDDLGAMEDPSLDDDMDLSPASEALGDAELGEDVLVEADVYISYGLHQQAQDLLTDAIAKEPNNNDYKAKLAEVYYNKKDQQEFEQYASKIKDEVGESSSQWQNIIAMGKELAPASALFAGAAGAATKAKIDKPKEADVDIGLETVIDNQTSDANIEDTILDNDVSAEDDSVVNKIMEANETPDILNFEVDDLSGDVLEDDVNTEMDAIPADLDETASMDDLTKELEQIGMQTTLDNLKPLDMDEGEFDIAGSMEDTVAMQASDLNTDTGILPADQEETAIYSPSSSGDSLSYDDTEQFDVSNIDTEFLDPAEQTMAETRVDLEELGPPSLIEEISTKLDLAKAFVDMGDSDAAKETLLEVINEGDESQIKAAKDLMDKLGS